MNYRLLPFIFILFIVFWFVPFHPSAKGSEDVRGKIESQIQQLEQETSGLNLILDGVDEEKRTLSGQVSTLNNQVRKREVELERINLAISKAGLDIEEKGAGITVLSERIKTSMESLAASIVLLYSYDQENIFSIFLKNRNLSDFFGALHGLQQVQADLKTTLDSSREDRERLGEERTELQGFRQEQEELSAFQEVERKLLAQKKAEKDELLRLTKGKEYLFEKLLQSKQKDIASLRTQLFYLEKTGITAEEAIEVASRAANRAGIRPAFLLALLEVETGKQFEQGVISVGSNLGTGNWDDDLYQCYQRLARYYGKDKFNVRAEREKEAFFSITAELGLDPNQMPVSKEPAYIGCGGAMGPAQFLPSTWLLFKNKVARLTGHNPPSPWNIEDAFTAAAVFLADAGGDAQTPTVETRAAKTYISGNPRCSSSVCGYYSRRILSLAKDINEIL